MATFYSLLFDIGVLAFFGLLYYTWQKNRIIKASTAQIRADLSDFIYELHEYLDGKEGSNDYAALNDFATELEQAIETPSLESMKNKVDKAPKALPEKLQLELDRISALF
ncbi:MAG: hypothetical protein KC478_14425 [Bacteriovoracaceae bacterium]|nr:hypothetical protein [Bacteriovoracaceae bacterium]